MKKTITFTWFLFCITALCVTTNAQVQTSRSVNNSVSQEAEDLRNLARRLFFTDQDSAMRVLHKSLNMALSVADSNLAIMIVADLGSRMYDLNQKDSVHYYYNYGLDLAENYQGRSYIFLLHNYGDFYANTDQFDKALDFYKKAELTSIEAKDSTFLPDIYARLGNLWFGFTDNYEQALKYFDLSNELAVKFKNSMFQYIYLYNSASVAMQMFPDSIGFTYMEKLLAMHRKRYPDLGRDANHFELATFIGLNQGDYEGNINRLKEYIHKANETSHHQATINGLERLANYFTNPDSSIYYLKKMQVISREVNDDLYELMGYRLISEKYAELNDYKAALDYYKRYENYADSINGVKQQNTFAEIREKYETQKKELEIANLNQQNLLQRTISNQRTTQRNWLFVMLLLFIIMAGLIFFYIRQRLKNTQLAASVASARITKLEQQQQIVTMNSMIEGQENERRRIAQDLHDGLGALLTTIKMHFSNIQEEITKLDELNMMEQTGALIEHANTEVRKIAHEMMPGSLVKLGLVEALAELCNRNSIDGTLDVHFEELNMVSRLDETAEIMIFRIIQELLNNIQKHAEATEVIVQLSDAGNSIELVVEDNGKGFDPNSITRTDSMGLNSVKSRTSFLNGAVTIESNTGTGTTVSIIIPKEKNVN